MNLEKNPATLLAPTEFFPARHIGPSPDEIETMLRELGYSKLSDLTADAVPAGIRSRRQMDLPSARTEPELLRDLRRIASRNQLFKNYIGTGYSDCFTPAVIQRNVLENPGWYTQYTPYQAEISQGRLEALLNFQTMVSDLTGLEIANASLLDEATAAAEAMAMCFSANTKGDRKAFLVARDCHPQTIAVLQTRAEPMGIQIIVGDHREFRFDDGKAFGVLVQYPSSDGLVHDYSELVKSAHAGGALVAMAADIMSLALLKSPGELGADVAIGSTQRFGVPMGFGGPHAAYFATRDEHKRRVPGRIVGVSKDRAGRPAIRLALQTREQHIRREKATSNICTAQVLLAVMASMYAVYHGPQGIRRIAERIHGAAGVLRTGLKRMGYSVVEGPVFDTVKVLSDRSVEKEIRAKAEAARINLRYFGDGSIGISVDETTSRDDLNDLFSVFAACAGKERDFTAEKLAAETGGERLPEECVRKTAYLSHPVFNQYHSETEMLRYIRKLESRDLSLTTSMIPLGSCTMKLNATTEMIPVTWPEFGSLHPFVPTEQAQGYAFLLNELEEMLKEVTGFDAVSLQPNAGSQGEYAGLLVIRQYHIDRGDKHRNVCLIPKSAHGTNPASAAMAGMKIVIVECDREGNIDVADLKAKAEQHSSELAALMVTYPSTHGVFEASIAEICEVVHKNGGQVYMDGANMNAQIGLCFPGEYGPDVAHLNLHKTFCIPHGGGGPGMGPIGVRSHLAPYLPGHPLVKTGGEKAIGPVSAAPWGSPSILPISWAYITMMGAEGLRDATEVAILNANYMAKRLDPHFPVLYKGEKGRVAHECIVDLRQLKAATGVEVEDVAKRLMDYGYHAPTVSFPVAGTLMIEPTESESKAEIDRFCDAMIAIRAEIEKIAQGEWDKSDNPLKNAPHTARDLAASEWNRPYSREVAVFPAAWSYDQKFWPFVNRIDSVSGDRNLICTCPPLDSYQS